MRGWLLDANVISELRKPRCDPRVKAWADANPTIAEIRFGIERVPPESPFRAELEIWLENGLRQWFAGRILDVDEGVILTWRRLVELGKVDDYTFAQPDLFIAATAVVHDLCVATRNMQDFLRARVLALDPWTDAVPHGAA